MSDKYAHLLGFVLDHPWAITPPMLQIIARVLSRRITGGESNADDIAAAVALRKPLPQPNRGGGVAIIPMYGVLSPRANMFSDSSGGTSFEKLTDQLGEAMGNAAVKTIVFDVDSPGGSVAGASEFAAAVRAARASKPIIAQAQYGMNSAAYWAMANATKIHMAPSASVGSIGVYTIHDDISEALAQMGIKRTYIASSDQKIEGHEAAALTDDARDRLKAIVNEARDRFHADVAKGRGVSESIVRKDYGAGRSLNATEALAAGMVDKVCTLDETLDGLMTPTGTGRGHAAHRLTPDTSQEPDRVTDQDRTAAHDWHIATELALLEQRFQ